MTMHLRRRRFLQAAGLTAGGLFLPSLRSTSVRAQAAEGPPRRLVVVFNELGWSHEQLLIRRPNAAALPTDRDSELQLNDLDEASFSRSLKPLHRHRNELLLVENLALHSAMADRLGDGHARAWLGVTTGAPARVAHEVKSEASMPSIDQVVLADIRRRNPNLTDLAGQHFGVHHGYNVWPGSFGSFHFGPFYTLDASGTPVPVGQVGDPQQAWDRLFAGRSDAVSPVEVARPSVLDKVRRRTAALATKLSAEDRRKLETHHDLLRDLEQRLRTLGSCGAPARMNRDGIEFVDDTAGGRMLRYNRGAEAFNDIIAASFGCDITRVSTLFLTTPDPAQVGETGDIHHEFSHPSDPSNRSAEGDHARVVMADISAHSAQHIASLIDRLKAIPEGSGNVFDSTTILWVNEIAHGGHGHDNMSAVVVAGKNTGFRTGRVVRYGNTFDSPALEFGGGGSTGRPFNQLLTSVARSVGVDVDSVGQRSVAGMAGTIDLTGEAPLLR
jgi:hypothetical protein